jgi:ribulose-phosphate 3-epimerase
LIKRLGVRAGVSLNPGTSLTSLEAVVGDVDLVLVMSVNPGFGGQSYIPGSTARIRRLRGMLDAVGSHADLEVDGGVKPSNAAEVAAAGASVLVAGSAVFAGDVGPNIRALKAAAGVEAAASDAPRQR